MKDWLEKYNNDGNTPIIVPTDAFKTFDFGNLAGQKQTKDRNKYIHSNIVNSPDQPMAGQGESWNDATNRVLPTLQNIINTAPANTTVITHNSVFGLMNLWNKSGRLNEFSKEQREAYTKQDGNHKTGDSFTIQGVNGPIHIVRHGETTDNASGNFRSDDAQLTEKGIKQAVRVGKDLSNIPQIITSSLPRAIATADIIASQQDDKKKEETDQWLDKYKDQQPQILQDFEKFRTSQKFKNGGSLQEYQPNFNESSISIPKKFVGEGYNNTPRRYSPSWGGQFKDGGQLTKLDQLTNFTNYNKPTPGGWLNQYSK